MILNKLVALATLAAAAVTDVEAGTHVRRAVDDGEDTDATQRNLGFLSSSSGKGKGGSKGSSTGGVSSSGSSGSKTSKSSKSSGGKGGSKGSSISSSSSGGDLGGGNTGESASDDGGGSTSNSASGSGTSRPTDFVLAALEENNKVRIARYERHISQINKNYYQASNPRSRKSLISLILFLKIEYSIALPPRKSRVARNWRSSTATATQTSNFG